MKSEPQLSVVIAVFNEAENVAAVTAETLQALAPLKDFEIVFVDDGSSDATVEAIRAVADPRVRVVRQTRSGKSQALRTGIEAARARWIGTMDGDGQNDPLDLLKMANLAWAADPAGPSPLVCGIRRRREDPWSRKVATKIGNGIRQALLNDGCPDTACGLKLFERGAFLRLPVFEGMHRFFPALFGRFGHPQILHDVNHRPRAAGASKYTNWGRALAGVGDLFGVAWLKNRLRAPEIIGEG